MKSYSISHAILGVTYVAVHQDEPRDYPSVIRLASPEDKEKFLLNTLQEGDKLYCENGGVTDKIALIALARGVTVYRVPTFRIGSSRMKQDGEIADIALIKWLNCMNWPIVEERAHGNESSHTLTIRRARVVAINAMSVKAINEFLEIGDPESRLLEIQRLYRAYRASQKVLIATYQRLLANYNDQYLLSMAKVGEQGSYTGNKVSTQAVNEAISALLVGIPENEREQFMARLGLNKYLVGSPISRNDVRKLFSIIIDAMTEDTVMSPFLASMKETVKEIKARLAEDKIYKAVFAQLPGCGPLITARIMASIVDIRRFESVATFKAYAGYHHFEDGSRARRRAGKASNWSTELKQAVYLWTQQTVKLKDSPWRAKLDLRRAYKLYKLLLQRQEMAMDMGLDEDIMPSVYWDRKIRSTYDMQPTDLEFLSTHIDGLRKKAGIKPVKVEEELSEEELAELESNRATNPELAKLTRGLKKVALNRAVRWLGQQFLKHIYKEWNKALDLPEVSVRVKKRKPTVKVESTKNKPKRVRTKKPVTSEILKSAEA